MSKQDRQGARTPADLDRKLGSEEVFNRLTNNGQAKGLFRDKDGNLYFNLDYGIAGKLSAEFIDVVKLIAQRLHAENADGDYIDIQDGQIIAGNKNDSEMEYFSLSRVVGGLFSLAFRNLNKYGERVHGSMMFDRISLGKVEQGAAPFGVIAAGSTNAQRSSVLLRLPDHDDHGTTADHEKELYIYWKANGDGSYSPVGYENELQ